MARRRKAYKRLLRKRTRKRLNDAMDFFKSVGNGFNKFNYGTGMSQADMKEKVNKNGRR